MSEPEQPHVVIVRERGGNVAAIPHGGFRRAEHGALAVEMLRHAGFIDDHGLVSRQYRLHWDMGREYENRQATKAARMLAAAGFRVDLDPSLDADRMGVAEPANQALAALSARLTEVDEPHEIATEVRAFFDPDHGALNQVASVLS
ncbi:hypothetical protein ABT391_20895, partial [Streptomyces jumonjinensis]